MVNAYHGATAMPPEVAAAIAALERKVAEVDALKSDEAASAPVPG